MEAFPRMRLHLDVVRMTGEGKGKQDQENTKEGRHVDQRLCCRRPGCLSSDTNTILAVVAASLDIQGGGKSGQV